MQFVLTGDDQVLLDGFANLSNDLANGTVAEISIPNDMVAIAVGKNGNAIYAKDESGRQFSLTLRILKGTDTDKGLLDKFNTVKTNFAGASLLTGQVIKKLGDGFGSILNYTISLSGGMITKYPENATNVNGDIEQAISIYTIVGVVDSVNIG